jgi:hypothetical protein
MISGRERKIMKKTNWIICRTVVLGLVPFAMIACSVEEPVSFATQVKPTLDMYCLECHQTGGAGFVASGLELSTRKQLTCTFYRLKLT